LLQPLVAQVTTLANEAHDLACEALALAVGGQIHDPQIHAQRAAVRFGLVWRFPVLRHMEVVDTLTPDQIGPANVPHRINQQGMLTRAKEQASDDASRQSVERHPIKTHQPLGAPVVADTAMGPEAEAGVALRGLHRLDRLDGFGSGAHGQLRARAKSFARFTIHPVMRRVRIGDTLIPAHVGNPIRRHLEDALSRSQDRVMAVNIQLAVDGARECFAH
jgi:hypothetical protein